MRFLADENVSRLVAERLQAANFDVMAIGATNPGASDNDVLATASRQGRILITEDRDFGELVVGNGWGSTASSFSSWIACRMWQRPIGWRQSYPGTRTSCPGTCL